MLIAKELKSLIDLSLPKSISCLHVLSTVYSSAYRYMLWDDGTFMSLESCSKVSSAAGKPRYTPPRQSRPYQPRACFLLRLSLRVEPFLIWPALKNLCSSHRFHLGKNEDIDPRISHSTSPILPAAQGSKTSMHYARLLKTNE